MKAALAILAALTLGACASDAQVAGGVATYDALKQAQSACVAKGGTFRLKSQGDSQYIDDYACKRD